MIPGASSGDIVLHVSDVSIRRGATRVLERVSFDVVDRIREGRVTGQVVSLLGPSGIGKTTLLRVLAGLELPERGEVAGPGGARLDAKSVGLVFQHYPLLGHRTIEDNLLVAGRVGGLDERRAKLRARELMERVGIEERAGFYPAQLSGGQRQRAAIAQQLVLPRRVLLLDEPFSGLDPVALGDVTELVTEVANDHELNTVVIVTHDIRAALRVSDTVILLGKSANDGGGASVRATFDLVELGLAWEAGRQAPLALAALEHEIEERFERLG
ncbi:MAG TPA: ATP-binding cassette domain-containing protein [Labilithrix sp.]|nr:ATP-binding cassette domain-containing protein [Labilithrix sp.]